MELIVSNLSIGFGDLPPVFTDFNLRLAAGERLGLVGLSGSGKSLVTLAILGLLPPAAYVRAGKITFTDQAGNHYDLLDPKNHRKVRGNKIGLVFQEPLAALNPVQRIGHQLAEAAGKDRDLVHSLLEKVELGSDVENVLNAYPHTLSGGQRQRVLIAMALARGPEFLIADEPTTALDKITEAEIVKLLNRLCREEKMGLLFISHDLQLLKNATDNITELGGNNLLNYSQSRPSDSAITKPEVAQNILTVEKLTIQYDGRDVPAAEAVNFTVASGEWVALVGPSGCGKTSVARAIAGLLGGHAGTVAIAGGRPTGMVFQDPFNSLNPRHSIGKGVTEVLRAHGLPKRDRQARAEELLRRVGLPAGEFYHRRPDALSGGQRQRVAIARALAARPGLLICDESVSALDAPLRHEVLTLLDRLRREESLALLFITHDLGLVTYYADRVLIMDAGRIVERGRPAAVFSKPASAMGRRLVEAARI